METANPGADARCVTRLLATLVGAALVLSGCATEEGKRAQELLQQAEVAQQALRSSTYGGEMTFKVGGQVVSMEFDGANSKEGDWFSMSANGIPGAGDFSMQFLRRGDRAWTNLDGSWQSMPVPSGLEGSASLGGAAFQQLSRYVKAVRVTEHQLVQGKPVTLIAGEIDTQGMIEAVTKLGSVGGGLDGLSLDVSKLGIEFGDIHAVLTIDERTHVLSAAFVTFSVEAEGQRLDAEIRYRLTSANEPVKLPTP